MDQKKTMVDFLKKTVILLSLVICAGVAGYAVLRHEVPLPPATVMLSADKKSVVSGDTVLFAIDNDSIFNWFVMQSQLCDGENRTNTAHREAFCESTASFRDQTRFSSLTPSPNKERIGFTIESDTLSPDKVVGIFFRPTNKIHMLTNYYLGNEFIGFSPSGANFAYQGNCFEARCGIFIKSSETLADKASLNNPEFLDARGAHATFVRWVSDNEVEYALGSELKRATF